MFTVVTWNVNGAKSSKAELEKLLAERSPDVVCLQEVKCKDPQWSIPGYTIVWNASTRRSNYAGTAMLIKSDCKDIIMDPITCCSDEGRVIAVTVNNVRIVCVYVPNSGVDRKEPLKRLDFRTKEWDPQFATFLKTWSGPLVVCGDLNVAVNEEDVHNPKSLRKKAGFTNQERLSFQQHLGSYTDAYMKVHGKSAFTFWGNYPGLKESNKGWRLDYHLCNKMDPKKAFVHKDYDSSDHVPLEIQYSY